MCRSNSKIQSHFAPPKSEGRTGRVKRHVKLVLARQTGKSTLLARLSPATPRDAPYELPGHPIPEDVQATFDLR